MSDQETESSGAVAEENPDPEEDAGLPHREDEETVCGRDEPPEEDSGLVVVSEAGGGAATLPGAQGSQLQTFGKADEIDCDEANLGCGDHGGLCDLAAGLLANGCDKDEANMSEEMKSTMSRSGQGECVNHAELDQESNEICFDVSSGQDQIEGEHLDTMSVPEQIEGEAAHGIPEPEQVEEELLGQCVSEQEQAEVDNADSAERGEEDSFEQDEALAAPECEGELRAEEQASESDQHPIPTESVPETLQLSPIVADEDSATSHVNSGDSYGVSSSCGSFSGDVQVVNTLEDAPEAELEGLSAAVCSDENAQVSGCAASPLLSENVCAPCVLAVSEAAGQAPINSEPNPDPQVPECDRLVVMSTETCSSDSTLEQEPSTVFVQDCSDSCSLSVQKDEPTSGQSSTCASSLNRSHTHTDRTKDPNSSNCDEQESLKNTAVQDSPALNVLNPSDEKCEEGVSNEVHINSQREESDDRHERSLAGDMSDISGAKPKVGSCPASSLSQQGQSVPSETTYGLSYSASTSPKRINGSRQGSPSPRFGAECSPSHISSVEKVLSQTDTMDSASIQRELSRALHSDDEDDDDILAQLDSEILASQSSNGRGSSGQGSPRLGAGVRGASPRRGDLQGVNGMQTSFEMAQLQKHNRELLEQLKIRDEEILRLTQERNDHSEQLHTLKSQSQSSSPSHNSDDLYLPQIKLLESTLSQQQEELKVTKEKLASHDAAAKRAVTTLQNELKSRVEQVTKLYEDCRREKDMMVVRFAESEAKNLEYKRHAEKCETKMKEAFREKDSMGNALKSARADRQRAGSNFEAKCTEINNLQKELEKMKEATNSMDYRLKWFQNKLKDELDSHKETKANLEKTNGRLKEAREETEIIRRDCQAIIKKYQESEEIKSNSLDKELKMKESELKLQMQERTDTEEVHQMIKRELDSLKSQHKDILEEAKTLKDKVHCLEEERLQNHQMIEKYQEIMQRQKSDNSDLNAQIRSLSTIDEDFKRAQDMIKSLDKEIADLRISNKDLQKDMDLCRERESKMLSLQSELSKSNALLRSENTNLSIKVSTLTGEVEKLRMEVQELESTAKDLGDKYEEEKLLRKQDVEKISVALDEKSKESGNYKQKWEDEVDSTKTLKRRHANNVKDLTRQLHQAKKRLETLEGKGDAGSMGSRTNSNGSLNSIDNSSAQQQLHPVQQPPPQEFPVITEQVEVDKQVLIERIVRLQKSLARKNEKLEFLGEHIQQLLEEIKKKNKIIQSYIMREEAGTLSSEDMDANKEYVNKEYKLEAIREIQSLLSRKGGIMASVYSVHQQDGTMTLDLSLQINKKLQAVLEDTLLKNITLKENLDTLGEEIARLSQQNRKLQLHLQDMEKQ